MLRRQGRGGKFLEEVLIVGGLLLVQCVLSGYVVFTDHLLALGADPLAVVVVAGAAYAAFCFPFAVALERKRWPSTVSGTLVAQYLLIALGGTTAFQALMLLGIKKTTPAIASAMPNLSPGLIFIVAACFRLERFDRACKYTQAKMAGTVVCLAGALAMGFLHSPTSTSSSLQAAVAAEAAAGGGDYYYDWILGCCCLVAAVTVFALVTVLQAATLAAFPAPLTMCCATSATGAALTAVLRLVLEGRFLGMGSPRIDATLVAGIVVLGGAAVGACMAFQAWCLGRKGPLFVSVFGPVQTVCTAILSAALLRQVLSLGSLAGIVLMFTGLYIVLWAKSNEISADDEEQSLQGGDDAEKALLA